MNKKERKCMNCGSTAVFRDDHKTAVRRDNMNDPYGDLEADYGLPTVYTCAACNTNNIFYEYPGGS